MFQLIMFCLLVLGGKESKYILLSFLLLLEEPGHIVLCWKKLKCASWVSCCHGNSNLGVLSLSLLTCRYHDRGNRFWEKLCTAEFRELYALGSIHNDLYVIGGQMKVKNQYLITNCVDKYSVDQDNWKRVSPLPLQLACHAVVSVNNKLYVIGGWTPQVKKFLAYLPGVAGFAERT